MGADDVRFDVFQSGVIKPHLGRLAATQVVPDDIAGFDEFVKEGAAFITLEVERDALFGEVKCLEVSAIVVRQRH